MFYRSAGGPGRPVRGRHAAFAPPDRKITAYSRARSPSLRAARRFWRPGAYKPGTMVVRRRRGGGRRQATGARIRKKHLRNRHLSLVLEVEIVAVAPPARGRRPAALRPTVEPAYRTQSGRSGFQICRVSAVRRQPALPPDALRPHRRTLRNPGDPRFTPTARHPRGNAASDPQQPQSILRTLPIIRGDRRSFNIYIDR